MKKSTKGFTLIELLVVVSIIGLLSSVVMASLNTARAKARDAVRRQALVQVRTALEMYYNDHGGYPIACGFSVDWNSHTVNANYIPGLVSGGYTPQLPVDPLGPGVATNDGCHQYIYCSADGGAHYKFISHCALEAGYSANDPLVDPLRPTWAIAVSNDMQLTSFTYGYGW